MEALLCFGLGVALNTNTSFSFACDFLKDLIVFVSFEDSLAIGGELTLEVSFTVKDSAIEDVPSTREILGDIPLSALDEDTVLTGDDDLEDAFLTSGVSKDPPGVPNLSECVSKAFTGVFGVLKLGVLVGDTDFAGEVFLDDSLPSP